MPHSSASIGGENIYYGAHADDASGCAYPDCSTAFVDAFRAAVASGTGYQVSLDAPFVGRTKADIIRIGLELGVPYHLTWSCYEGGENPCGTCGTCIEREAAFRANGVCDPLLREAST